MSVDGKSDSFSLMGVSISLGKEKLQAEVLWLAVSASMCIWESNIGN